MRLKLTTTLKAGLGKENQHKKNKIFDDSKEEIPEEIIAEYESGSGTIINLGDPTSTPKRKPKKSEAQLLKAKLLKEQKAAKKKKDKKKDKKKSTKKTGKLLKKKK